jgi:hypothetical protein
LAMKMFGIALEKRGEIAATIDDALDADDVYSHSKKNDVISKDRNPRPFADLRTKLIEERLLTNPKDFLPNLIQERKRAVRIVFGNESGDCVKVTFDEAGEL